MKMDMTTLAEKDLIAFVAVFHDALGLRYRIVVEIEEIDKLGVTLVRKEVGGLLIQSQLVIRIRQVPCWSLTSEILMLATFTVPRKRKASPSPFTLFKLRPAIRGSFPYRVRVCAKSCSL